MNLRVIYPFKIPYLFIRFKTKLFFRKTPYLYRHGVLSYSSSPNTYFIRRHSIDILLNNTDDESIHYAYSYLKYIFGTTQFGLSISNCNYYKIFSSLNYIKI